MYTPTNETDFAAAYARGERDFDLSDYAHPLPASLTTTGHLDLRGYAHPLPASLRENNLRPTDDWKAHHA